MSFSGIAHPWPLRAPTSILLAEPFQLFFAFQLPSKYETPLQYIPVLLHQVCRYHQILYAVGPSHAHPAQISPAIYSPAAQRSAVRSRAVRCRALRCGAVSLRCVLSFENRAVSGIMRVVYGVLLFLFFLFLHVFDLSRPRFFPHANYPHTADQTPVTKAHSTAEHNRAICSAQAALGIIRSLFASNHGSLLSAPCTYVFSCILRCLARA